MHEVSAWGLRRRGVGAESQGGLAAPLLSRCLSAVAVVFGLALAAGPAIAAGSPPIALSDGKPSQVTKLAHPDIAAGDQFGYCVALSGDTALVGAYLEEAGATTDAGAAHVFVKGPSGWIEEATLTAPSPRAYGWFGWSVALDGDTAVVGSRYGGGETGNAGLVNVFVRSAGTWSCEATLAPEGGDAADVFGQSAAISGDTVVVGAPQSDLVAASGGAAYVFTRSGPTWSPDATLLAADGGAEDQLGYSVAVSGDRILAGAPWHGHSASDGGAAYAFRRTGGAWSSSSELSGSTIGEGDRFGLSVALSGLRAAVGIPYADQGGADAGAVDLYESDGSTWTLAERLVAGAAAPGDWFGYSVALMQDDLAVGAPWHDGAGSHSGLAYAFSKLASGWGHVPLEPGLAAGDYFGRAVAVSTSTAIAGAFGDDGSGSLAGAAYVFAGLPAYATAEDTTLTVSAPGVLANDMDPESDPLSAVLDAGPGHGSLSLDASGSFTYRPDPDYHGTDVFTYLAFDGASYSATATATITVTPVNDPPVATADTRTYEGDVAGGYGGALSGVFVADIDDATSTVVLTNDAASPLPLGSNTVHWTATDSHGGQGQVDQSVQVTDTMPPTDPLISGPSHTIGVTSSVAAVEVTFAGASDVCAGVHGYSVSWSADGTETPDTVEDLGAAADSTTSSRLGEGTWWFNLRTVDAAGNWSAGRHLGPFVIGLPAPTELTISRGGVSLVGYGRAVVFSGRLTSEGETLAGRRVGLERRAFGTAAWVASGDATTDASGLWQASARLYQNTYWRARFDGDVSYAPTISPEVWVRAKAALPAPSVPAAVYRNRTFTLKGFVYPAHGGRTTIYLYQYVGRRLVYRGYRYMTNYRLSGRSLYRGLVRLPYAGRWMVRARHADTDHYLTWGTPRIVTVR